MLGAVPHCSTVLVDHTMRARLVVLGAVPHCSTVLVDHTMRARIVVSVPCLLLPLIIPLVYMLWQCDTSYYTSIIHMMKHGARKINYSSIEAPC